MKIYFVKALVGKAEKASWLEGLRCAKAENATEGWEFGDCGREEGLWQEAGGKGLLLGSGVGALGR